MGSFMDLVELRNLDEARAFLLQGLWLQRVVNPAAGLVKPALEWALEIASNGQPLPPVGFVADLGNVVYGLDRGRHAKDHVEVPGWPHTLARSYEDHLLGKLYNDWTFERATDALRRYVGPRDQAKGLAYVVKQVRERGKLGGVELSPAVIRGLLALPPEDLLKSGYESLEQAGPMPLLVRQYEGLVSAARRMAEVLGPEDVVALEQRTALADMGQYVAHRQILQMTARLEARLPARPVRPLVGRKEVPTRVMDEDQYPVGGYSAISTRGSIESLLHSQLAYMEPESPDLFDLKFVRDELFYYSRDENQFLRRRRAFVFAIHPSLTAARFKDPDLPTQRVVLALSAVLTLVRRLTEWLSTDALKFEVLFVHPGAKKWANREEEHQALKQVPLAHEAELLALLLREPLERGAVELKVMDGVEAFCAEQARHSQVHCLVLSAEPARLTAEGAVVTHLTVAGPRPDLTDANGLTAEFDADDAFDHWSAAVTRILELWI
jgi:hypothetical protein